MDTSRTPWERQFNEPRKAYAAFCIYRDMGTERTVKAAYEIRQGKQGVTGRWHTWCLRWRWVERTEAWDAHQEAVRREAEERAFSAHYEKLAAEKLAYQDTSLALVHALIAQVTTMLSWPLAEQRLDNEDGVTIIKPARWSKADIPRMLEVADKLMRLTLGLETERVSLQLEAEVKKIAQEMAAERGIDIDEVMADLDATFKRP